MTVPAPEQSRDGRLDELSEAAADELKAQLSHSDPWVRLRAAESVLDRTLGRPVEQDRLVRVIVEREPERPGEPGSADAEAEVAAAVVSHLGLVS